MTMPRRDAETHHGQPSGASPPRDGSPMTRGHPKPPAPYIQVTVRFQPGEHADLTAWAAHCGVSLSRFIRIACEREMRRGDDDIKKLTSSY